MYYEYIIYDDINDDINGHIRYELKTTMMIFPVRILLITGSYSTAIITELSLVLNAGRGSLCGSVADELYILLRGFEVY